MKGSKFVTLAQLSEELGASRATVRGWLAEGGVDAYTFGSGVNATLRYLRSQVDDWIDDMHESENPAPEEVDEDEADEDEADDDDDDDDQEDEDLDDDELDE